MAIRLNVTIGIATKDRPIHLAATVARLADIVPNAAELLVIDDGSAEPVSLVDTATLPFPVRMIRHSQSKGGIASRNEIVRECRTAFVLSCDDDSCPLTGSIAMAVTYLNENPDLMALSFPYLEGRTRKPMNPSLAAEPYSVRQFIGCAHLIRADYVKQLGGYWEWLVQQNEERELCYRALTRGWGVAHFPGVTFYHDYTPIGRNWNRHEFYTMRNEMAVELLYAPRSVVLMKIVRNLVASTLWSLRHRRTGYLRGYCRGLFSRPGKRPGRVRLTLRQYCKLAGLGWA